MLTTTQILQSLLGGGLTQIEIARRTGIPQPRISRWAAGETPESADDALRLAQLHAERQPAAAATAVIDVARPVAAQEAA